MQLTCQLLRDAPLNTADFKGVTGNHNCNETIEGITAPGDRAGRNIAVYQIRGADPAAWHPGTADSTNPKKLFM